LIIEFYRSFSKRTANFLLLIKGVWILSSQGKTAALVKIEYYETHMIREIKILLKSNTVQKNKMNVMNYWNKI